MTLTELLQSLEADTGPVERDGAHRQTRPRQEGTSPTHQTRSGRRDGPDRQRSSGHEMVPPDFSWLMEATMLASSSLTQADSTGRRETRASARPALASLPRTTSQRGDSGRRMRPKPRMAAQTNCEVKGVQRERDGKCLRCHGLRTWIAIGMR